MGQLDARARLTTVRRLCGHESMGPRRVVDQSVDLINFAISPPPMSQSVPAESAGRQFISAFNVDTCLLGGRLTKYRGGYRKRFTLRARLPASGARSLPGTAHDPRRR